VVEEPQETTSKTGEDEGIILKLILWKQGGSVWTGFVWLRIGTGGWFL
jgi:hypothetical protein